MEPKTGILDQILASYKKPEKIAITVASDKQGKPELVLNFKVISSYDDWEDLQASAKSFADEFFDEDDKPLAEVPVMFPPEIVPKRRKTATVAAMLAYCSLDQPQDCKAFLKLAMELPTVFVNVEAQFMKAQGVSKVAGEAKALDDAAKNSAQTESGSSD